MKLSDIPIKRLEEMAAQGKKLTVYAGGEVRTYTARHLLRQRQAAQKRGGQRRGRA